MAAVQYNVAVVVISSPPNLGLTKAGVATSTQSYISSLCLNFIVRKVRRIGVNHLPGSLQLAEILSLSGSFLILSSSKM